MEDLWPPSSCEWPYRVTTLFSPTLKVHHWFLFAAFQSLPLLSLSLPVMPSKLLSLSPPISTIKATSKAQSPHQKGPRSTHDNVCQGFQSPHQVQHGLCHSKGHVSKAHLTTFSAGGLYIARTQQNSLLLGLIYCSAAAFYRSEY